MGHPCHCLVKQILSSNVSVSHYRHCKAVLEVPVCDGLICFLEVHQKYLRKTHIRREALKMHASHDQETFDEKKFFQNNLGRVGAR